MSVNVEDFCLKLACIKSGGSGGEIANISSLWILQTTILYPPQN